jgi:RimJ/RimL family protein N-acetyltransferase
MTAAFATLLREWCIPRMGMHRMRVNVLTGNRASVRVFEKNGFVLTGAAQGCINLRGKMAGLDVLEWKLDSK